MLKSTFSEFQHCRADNIGLSPFV